MRLEPVKTDPRIFLDPERTTLLIIDIQEKFIPHLIRKDDFIRNTMLLIELAKIMSIPIIVTEHNPKGLGKTIKAIKDILPRKTKIIEKHTFSTFSTQEFVKAIQEIGDASRTLLVAGIESHICIMQSVLEALSQGYKVHVAGDAVTARSRFNWEVGLKRMEQSGAVISSAEMASYELLRRSDTATFKEFLPVIKVLSQKTDEDKNF